MPVTMSPSRPAYSSYLSSRSASRYPLLHHQARSLGGYAAEILRRDLELVAHGVARIVEILGHHRVLHGVGVYGHPRVLVGTGHPLVRGFQAVGEGAQQCVDGYPPLHRYGLKGFYRLRVHGCVASPRQCDSRV